ncbi:MAG: T9SS type A sorting domain-containing protein, partial [Muribaculaceae bacterium]|nr:T9SS type A sorting domain-containing protein [Muribaculaceae bacterium]
MCISDSYEMKHSKWDDSAERTASIDDIDLSGVEEVAVDRIAVRVNGNVLTVNAPAEIETITIYSIDGRAELLAAPAAASASIALDTLPAGVHIVRVAGAFGTTTLKFVR